MHRFFGVLCYRLIIYLRILLVRIPDQSFYKAVGLEKTKTTVGWAHVRPAITTTAYSSMQLIPLGSVEGAL